MKVKELIEKLKELPEDATIGTFYECDRYIENHILICTNKDRIYTPMGYIFIKDVENGRISNKERLCDYYLR